MTIAVYFVEITDIAAFDGADKRLKELPPLISTKIRSYKNVQEQLIRLCGKLLFAKLLSDNDLLQVSSLGNLSYNEFAKPFISADFDFNIAHSGNIAVCTLAKGSKKIGIDIEQIKYMETAVFKDQFTIKEWRFIESSDHPVDTFYKLWVRKEAVMKATGKGIFQPMAETEAIENEVIADKTFFYVRDIYIANGYVASIAATEPVTDIQIKEISIDTLLDTSII